MDRCEGRAAVESSFGHFDLGVEYINASACVGPYVGGIAVRVASMGANSYGQRITEGHIESQEADASVTTVPSFSAVALFSGAVGTAVRSCAVVPSRRTVCLLPEVFSHALRAAIHHLRASNQSGQQGRQDRHAE
jgi:hypothetical protein